MMSARLWVICSRRPRINQARGEPIRDPKPLFDLAQRQNAAV